jgi:hypothetical protein
MRGATAEQIACQISSQACPMDNSPENVGWTAPLRTLKTHAGDMVDRVAEFNCHQYGRADNKIETEMHNSLDPDIVVGLALFRARRETKL